MDPFSAILCNAILIGKNKCVRIRKMEDGENSRVNFFLARCSAFVWSYSWHDRPWRWRASSMRWWSATEGRYGVVGDGYSAKEPGNLATCVGQRPMIIAYRPIHLSAELVRFVDTISRHIQSRMIDCSILASTLLLLSRRLFVKVEENRKSVFRTGENCI